MMNMQPGATPPQEPDGDEGAPQTIPATCPQCGLKQTMQPGEQQMRCMRCGYTGPSQEMEQLDTSPAGMPPPGQPAPNTPTPS